MTEYDLYPSFLKVDYTTAFGVHVHVIPTRAWNPVSVSGALGSYENWDGTPRDAEDMIGDLVAKMAPIHKDDTLISLVTIFNKSSTTAPAIPVASKALAVAGTSALTTHAKAITAQFNFRTVNFHPVKLVFLDVPHPATDFLKENLATTSVANAALALEFMSSANAWSGRDNTAPNTLISVTWNINQELRKQYKMA